MILQFHGLHTISKQSLTILILLIISAIAHTQNQNNFWVYGYQAGINFNTNPPSYQGGFAIQASEGAASVADPVSGELLFYTDGVTVWDASNNPMPNGTGLLGGDPVLLSSTTAAVICEKPGNSNQYYLITVDEQASNNGLRYSVVDMTLNGGLGDIVAGQKNILIFSTNAEKACIVPNAAGTGYWLLSHDLPGDTFYAFAITAAGINTTPVTTTIGGTQGNGAGFLKVSPQFNRVAIANLFFQDAEVYDFDNSTGIFSNAIILNLPGFGAAGGAYGIEFSCNGDLLYVSDGSNLIQYNLTLGNAAAIMAGAYSVLSNSFSCYGLQLGPDRKIYVSNGALDVINNPDIPGAGCDYQSGAIPGQQSGGGWGLPQWVYRVGDTPLVCTACEPETAQLTINTCGSYTLPDGSQTSTPGVYSFTLQNAGGCDSTVTLTLNINSAPQISIAQNAIGCGSEVAFSVSANGNGPFQFAIPSENLANNNGNFTLGFGSFELIVTDSDGCSTSTSLINSISSSCPADFDQDLVVGVTDLQQFNAAYGCTGNCCPYDLNGDNSVSVADLLSFISAFGMMCE
jgi:hypothetical protein